MKNVTSLLTILLFVTSAGWVGLKTVVVETKLISQTASGMTSGGNRHPSISDDGRYIVFSSSHSDLLENDTNDSNDVILHDTQTRVNTLVSSSNDGNPTDGSSSRRSDS